MKKLENSSDPIVSQTSPTITKMFGLGVKRILAQPIKMAVQSVRTFIPLKKAVPTVFEPLPKKRNGENALSFLNKELLSRYDPTGKRRALVDSKTGLRAGDIIKVTYLDRTDVVGRVIGIKRGENNVGTNILIRNKINRIGCEVRIPVFSPKLRNIEVVHKPETYLPRAKQYYIRNTKLDVDDVEAFIKRQHKKNQ